MNISSIISGFAFAAVLLSNHPASAQAAPQKTFATAEDAIVALVDLEKAGNLDGLRALFGPGADKVLVSGDPVMDQRHREVFLTAYAERAGLMAVSATSSVLYIGNEDWPFPIPLVKEGQSWRFDTAAGAQEVLYRRIGRNELTTIRVCQAYVDAQREYAAKSHDGKPAGAYAQKIASTPGKQDGLYWKSADPENLSPLGEFAAEAAAEGYRRSDGQPAAYHGYLFRVLAADGSSKKAGFGLIATPAIYGTSGVMSFMVNQEGVVYEQDLGPDTAASAAKISQFTLDPGWSKVE